MKRGLIILSVVLSYLGAQDIAFDLDRIERATLRINKDLEYVPDQYFDTPASGHVLKAMWMTENILDAFEENPINDVYIISQGRKLSGEIKLMNRKGSIKDKRKKNGNVQVMFISSGS